MGTLPGSLHSSSGVGSTGSSTSTGVHIADADDLADVKLGDGVGVDVSDAQWNQLLADSAEMAGSHFDAILSAQASPTVHQRRKRSADHVESEELKQATRDILELLK